MITVVNPSSPVSLVLVSPTNAGQPYGLGSPVAPAIKAFPCLPTPVSFVLVNPYTGQQYGFLAQS